MPEPDNLSRNSPEEEHDEEMVTVLSTSRVSDLPVVESLLRASGIPFFTEGEGLMNLFPSELLGNLFKSQAEVRFKVPASRAEEAREILDNPPENLDEQALQAADGAGETTERGNDE